MRNLLPKGIFLLLLFFSVHVTAQVTVGTVNKGPYGSGSSISVPISIISGNACFSSTNKFELYISDANGNFGTERKIGESSGFFSTHVNGVIPANIAGSNYKLRVKSTDPASVSNVSGAINILTGAGPVTEVTPSSASQLLSPGVFGWCGSAVGEGKSIVLKPDAGSTVQTLVLTNAVTGTTRTYTPTAAGFSIENLATGYYTVTITGEKQSGGQAIRSVKTYLLLNVPSKVNIQSGGEFGCIDPETGAGATISYSVNISGATGIQNNYPGSLYQITWGDGKEDLYTHCQLMANGGLISHNFQKTSCGQPPINLGNGTIIENAFKVSVKTVNPFCQQDPVIATTYPKIFERPVAHIDPTSATAVCINTPIVFKNTSRSGNNSDCSLTMEWKWYVDGVLASTEKTFTYEGFKTPGIHSVKLVANNDVGLCRPSEETKTICVQSPPKPSFSLNGANTKANCAPFSLKPVNTSVIDNNCNTDNTYLWSVTGGNVAYENGTNEKSKSPEFRFTSPGIYKISLAVNTASCGMVTTPEQTVVVNGTPTAMLSDDLVSCNLTTYEFSPTTNGPTKTTLNGTTVTQPDTYTWTVTGGDFAFAPGSDMHAQYPKIEFKEYKAYTVTVIHKNNCNTATDSQTITFKPSPVVNAGSYPAVCFNETIHLQGAISGNVNSFEWVGGNGNFNPGRNVLDAVYTPSPDERAAGKVDLILRATTSSPAPCNIVEGFASITIKPENVINSPNAKSICIGQSVAYSPVALPGSNFRWEVTDANNVTGFANTGSGKSINDALNNTDTTLPGTVTYRIVPVLDGCEGRPFDFKVTVAAKPSATATAADAIICSGSPAGISVSSTQSGLKYLWQSSVSNPSVTGNTQNTTTPAAIDQINDTLVNNGSVERSVTYVITPVNELGCEGTPVTVKISVKPAPVLTNNQIGSDQLLCEGNTAVPLTGSVPSGEGGVYAYQWESSSDGTTWTEISGATAQNYVPGIVAATTYYRRMVVIPNCSGTASIPGNVIKITVNPNAKAEFDFVSDKGCAPFEIDASNIKATEYADRNDTYTWYADGTEIGNGPAFPGYTIAKDDQSVVIKLVVTSSKGCEVSEISHTFSTQQTILAAFAQDQTEGCGPLTVNFTNQSTSLANTSFEWDFGNGQKSDQATPGPVTFLPDSTGKDKIYTITLVATSACGASAPFTATVLVHAQPLSMFSPEVTTGCSPLAVTFSNTSPVASNTTYTYDFGDGSPLLVSNDRNSVTHTFTATGLIKTYTVTMTTKGPCGTHTSQHLITVSPNTVIAELVVNGPDRRGCAPFTVPFFNNSTGADNFAYDFGDGSTANTIRSPERVEHTFTKPGVYTITLTASNGCSTSTTTETVTVLPQPAASFTARRNEECACLEVGFTNTSIDAVSYLWDFGDGATSVETNPVHAYATAGNYKITLTATNQNGCTASITNDFEVTGVPGTLFVPNAFIPGNSNPELRLFSAKGFGLKTWKFSVFDKWGELLWETSKLDDGKPGDGWDGTFKGQQMPQGVYFWKADVQFINGSEWKGMTYGSSAPKRTGIINLIR